MKRIICAVLCAALAGCGDRNTAVAVPDGWLEASSGGYGAAIKEVTLPSGRQCVLMVGYNKGALTCDWGTK